MPLYPAVRSEEHTSELQSRVDLVCRLLLEKKKKHHRQLFLKKKKKKIESIGESELKCFHNKKLDFNILFLIFSMKLERIQIFFFFNDTATTDIYTLSLHDALPILPTIASQDEIHTANSLTQTTQWTTLTVGTFLGATVIAIGYKWAFVFNALS